MWQLIRAVLEMEPPTWTAQEFAVLVTLANFVRSGKVTFVSKPTIAKRVGLKPRQVWNILHSLQAKGLIRIEEGAGPRGCHRYQLLFAGKESSQKTMAPDCHSDRAVTVANDCQSGQPDYGNQRPSTLVINNSDSGNPIPQLWQPAASNPCTTVQNLKKEPVAPSALASSDHASEETREDPMTTPDRINADFLLVRSVATAAVSGCATKDELATAVHKQMGDDVDPKIRDAAVTFVWAASTAGHSPTSA